MGVCGSDVGRDDMTASLPLSAIDTAHASTVLRIALMTDTTALDAAAFRRLLKHLNQDRPEVQNIDLMILAGFCRNCLADWYCEAAVDAGVAMNKEQARERVYGMPFADWKAQHQRDATPEQLAAFKAAQERHG